MTKRLVFSLTSNMAAMGELAGHHRRGTLVWPGRSAILGLLGAALGIQRGGDFAALDALQVSVVIFDTGTLLRDYHTVQTVPTAAVKKPNSRPEALRAAQGENAANTTLTVRDYRTDTLYGIVVTGDGLDAIAKALTHPRFTLYMGRKSCPLAAPTGAKVIQTTTEEEAIDHIPLPPWRSDAIPHTFATEGAEGEVVHDVPLDRTLWHHGHRTVVLRTLSDPLEGQT